MLSHIAKNLYETYLIEMVPQLERGKDGDEVKVGASGLGDESAKRIRQAVYDIRYRARREDIRIDQAYSQYMSHTSMPANEKSAVRDKLGLGPGGQVSEDAQAGKFYLRINPKSRKTNEKEYIKKFDPSNERDRKKRHGLQKKGIITTVTKHGNPYDGAGEKFEKKFGPTTGKNTVGDKDRDGTVEPDRHEYAGVKDTAIKNAMSKISKKRIKKESFSSWRNEICEVVEKINDIKEKEVNEKNSKKNKIIVNPDVKTEELASALGAELVESIDLGENYIEQVANFATEYFYAKGLNENGLEILVREMGEDKFSDYVFYLAEDYFLTEARSDGSRIEPVTKGGKSVGSLKGGAKSAAIGRLRKEKSARKESESSASAAKPSGLTAALKSQSSVAKKVTTDKGEKSVENAKSSQSPATNKSSEGTKKEVKKGVLGHLKQSWQTARAVGKEHEARVAKAAGTVAGATVGAAKAVHRAGQEFGKSQTGQNLKSGVAKTAKAAVGAAGAGIGSKVAGKSNAAALGRAAGTFIRKMREDFELWIDELIDEGYYIENYDFADLVELYIPEGIDEGLGTAVSNVLFGTKEQQLAKSQQERESRKQAIASKKPQRKEPAVPIKTPSTSERDPWSGNPDTDKAWTKNPSSASTPRAYRREEFEEWMEAFFEEIDMNENMLFLIFESNFMAGGILIEDEDPCWKGYTQVGMKKKGGREVPNCVPSKGVSKAKGYKKEEVDLEEKAPPGAKFERMVNHIKKGYSKKDKLSKEEKSIAYATSWKHHNEEYVDEAKEELKQRNKNEMQRKAGNLGREVVSSNRGSKRTAAMNRMGKLVTVIGRDDENKRFKTLGQSPSHNPGFHEDENVVDPVVKKQADLKKKLINKKNQTYNVELNLVKQGKIPLDTSYKMKGDVIGELNRFEKERGINTKNGRPTQTGGNPAVAARNKPPLKYGGSRQEPKVPGEKPPGAGETGSGIQDPAHRVAVRRANIERAKKDPIGSRFD